MGVITGISALIASYEGHVKEGLEDDDTSDTSALLALIARDSLEDQWQRLTAGQRQRVELADALLAQKHARVAEILPNALSRDRRRWWWFLHEGPQVREEALEATKEH